MLRSTYKFRRLVKMLHILRSGGVVNEPEINPGATWVDDWFTVEYINDKTVAISEPRYFLRNNSYVIMGDHKAVLFDTGSGKRDIKPLVEEITSLPLAVITSHAHSDHMGNIGRFRNYALPDLPVNRRCTHNDIFIPSLVMYSDLSARPKVPISSWLNLAEPIDLGNRCLDILHVPGHSPDSVALLDKAQGMIFSGDFLYQGNLICTLGGSVSDYIASTQQLITITSGEGLILPAHYTRPLQGKLLLDLEAGLLRIINGEVKGRRYTYSRKYPINEELAFITTRPMVNNASRQLRKSIRQ